MKKKILIFTGSRADYGLLKPLISRIKKDKRYKFLIAAGSHHFSKNLGFTYKEIIKDNFKINYACPVKINNTTFSDVSQYFGNCISDNSRYLEKKRPDIVILYGDRYEVFSFCIASFFLQIPIIHIHGGEITEGAFDDSLRHSITKLSNYHFVSHNAYKKRIIRLGEHPSRVYNFGALGVENIKKTKLITKKILFRRFKIPLDKKIILITFHPETQSNIPLKKQIKIFLSVLNRFKNIYFVFTYNNADPEGNFFINEIKKFQKKNKNVKLFSSLGVKIYHSLIKNVDLVIGNSSSGVLEVPSLKTPTLNIGNRQKGRLFSRSVFCCDNNKKEIEKKIKKILFSNLKIKFDDIYYKKNTSILMFNKIKNILNKKNHTKKFYDAA